MRRLLVRSRAFGAAMTGGLAGLAEIGVGADEHPAAFVVGDDFIEVGILRPAQRAGRVEEITRERMILEVERHHRSMRRYRKDSLFAPVTEQLHRRASVHLWIVELQRRRSLHS